ncbi:MAG: NAD(P)-binding domain-containing protein, partial [Gammaproteobacteria bacterium]|nr:NAD(P)-binding domain-containing protein [Gammaproteobacteria bacterium]
MTSIAFLGAGNIAQAIMGGLIENGFAPEHIIACDPVKACTDRAREKGIMIAGNNDEAVERSDVILLCVKPNIVTALLDAIRVNLENKLLISVAAGITTSSMAASVPAGTAIVRCMPNTPALVQTG